MRSRLLYVGALLILISESVLGQEPNEFTDKIKELSLQIEQGDKEAKKELADRYFDGRGVERNFEEAARLYGCPKPSKRLLETCTERDSSSLPKIVRGLLKKEQCSIKPHSYYGFSVDLKGDGGQDYQLCCSEPAHGPCPAILLSKIGSKWKEISGVGLLGYTGACNGFVVLESQHHGYHDICLPNECSKSSIKNGGPCVPKILEFDKGTYREQ